MIKKARIHRTMGLAGGLFLLHGCSSDSRDVGEGLSLDRSQLESYAASWDGYVEAFEFQSTSDRVRIELDENGNGTIRFGNLEPIEPADDPDELYPPPPPIPGWGGATGIGGYMNMGGSPFGATYEAYIYSISGARVEDERIRLEVDVGELYDSWCDLQASYLDPNSEPGYPRYSCAPSSGWTSDGTTCWLSDPVTGMTTTTEWDCGKLWMCSGSQICECDEEGCISRESKSISMDAALDDDGESLEGTLVLPEAGRLTVRLRRQ